MELTAKFKAAKDIIATEMDRETVLMHVQQGEYFSLNETGRLVWKELEKGEVSLESLINAMMNQYEIEEAQCRKDMEELLDSMFQKGVLEKVS